MRDQGIAGRMAMVVARRSASLWLPFWDWRTCSRFLPRPPKSMATTASEQTQGCFALLDLVVKVQGFTQKLVQETDPDAMESLIQQNQSLVKDAQTKA